MTIAQLEKASGLRRRTIHYYTQAGLIPAPRGAGRGARYGERHLLRLRLIPLFKTGGLRLDRIATALAALTDEQMRSLLAAAGASSPRDPCELADWLAAARRPAAPPGVRLARAVDGSPARPKVAPRRGSVEPGTGAGVARPSQWERHPVRPWLEIHLRADADPEMRRRVEELRRYADRVCGPTAS